MSVASAKARVPVAPFRLPSHAGLFVRPDRPLRFRFEGREYSGLEGDSIASALLANGLWLLSRSFKYHRPRGPLSMAGLEADTLVEVNGEPNVAADLEALREGMEIRGQNCGPFGLRYDPFALLGCFARFMPVGFYYKAMYLPRPAWQHFWEPLVRRMTGLGRVRRNAPPAYYDKAYAFCDVAVIGAGPAGLAAALEAARHGAEVWLVEQEAQPGGMLNYARGAPGVAEQRAALLREVAETPNIQLHTGTLCNAWFADNWLPLIQGQRLYKLRARELVLATGVMEQPAVFRNNDLPGVLLGSAAQRLLRLYGVCPGRRAVVLTSGPQGYEVALDLLDAGAEVNAIVDLRPTPGPEDAAFQEAVGRGLSVFSGSCVLAAEAGRGGRLGSVQLARITSGGGCEASGVRLECDLLCMSTGCLPTYQLALQAGASLVHGRDVEGFRISGLPPHMRLAGAVHACGSLDRVLADGQAAGAKAALAVNGEALPGSELEEGAASQQESGQTSEDPAATPLWPIFPHARGKEFVDRDEDLQIADILNACADGYAELELVKRYSTVGMGPSQGRHSALATARLVARATGRDLAQVGVTTARPPLVGEKLGVLAGRCFEPERHTAMHHRHLEAGAHMLVAGLWWRPAYYAIQGATRDRCVREEVAAVRTGVGMIDVSTLGALEVRGPDAAEFLNRIYTFAYKKQAVGRVRYVLMTNMAGVVMDDGVACRLGDEHFYVTATTGGVENVYRNMLWWNAQWRLRVDVCNVTAAYAAVSLSGPRARDLLRELCQDVPLGGTDFPYLGVRCGHVAGIPARLLRIGFVGELGYEIHVPANHGEALWDALLHAAPGRELRPVGIEAQRLLRLEKGHVIIGQDTDAMSTPRELQMDWAVATKKPFFVGRRSLELRARCQSARRRLVAFEVEPSHKPETTLKESCLLLRDGAVTGHVTSVAWSPTLQKMVGLAYAPASAQVGEQLHIQGQAPKGKSKLLSVRVVTTPFYDPENKRQEM